MVEKMKRDVNKHFFSFENEKKSNLTKYIEILFFIIKSKSSLSTPL